MKKTLALILAVMMVFATFALAGCGKDKTPTGDNGTAGGQQNGSNDTPPAGGSNDTPAGGGNDTPAGGSNDTPAGGSNDTPAGGSNDTPAGGSNDTPAGGSNDTPAGGGNDTPAGGGNDTPASGGNNDTPAGGNDTPAAPHTHAWDAGTVAQAATCTAEGAKLYTCACGESKLESIPKLTEHTFDSGKVEGSIKTFTCTACGETKTEVVSSAGHEHTWGAPVTTKAATCGEDGSAYLACACGQTVNVTLKKTGEHKPDVTGICTVCGDLGTVASPSDIG